MAKFAWRPKAAQFWNATVGKLVPALRVRQAADIVIDASPVKTWAADVAGGRMDVATFQQNMRDELRRNYIQQYLAGRGGTGPMTAREYGSIGGMLKEQYHPYLDRFCREIAGGKLSEGQIARRAAMYVNSAREAYERARERAAKDAELEDVRWAMDPSPKVEHCSDCRAFQSLGWRKVEPWPFMAGRAKARPASGHTQCLTSCRCSLHWRKAQARRKAFGGFWRLREAS